MGDRTLYSFWSIDAVQNGVLYAIIFLYPIEVVMNVASMQT